MPIYVYKNLITGETFELQQRMSESALTTHPETGEPVKRLIQPVGIAFKGSGFYVTDSKSSSKETSAKKDESKSDSGKGEKNGAAKSDAKPKETPKETKASVAKDG